MVPSSTDSGHHIFGARMAKIICAWCNVVMYDSPTERVSHGICDDCMEEQLAGLNDDTELEEKGFDIGGEA